jgi:hypothetical protein
MLRQKIGFRTFSTKSEKFDVKLKFLPVKMKRSNAPSTKLKEEIDSIKTGTGKPGNKKQKIEPNEQHLDAQRLVQWLKKGAAPVAPEGEDAAAERVDIDKENANKSGANARLTEQSRPLYYETSYRIQRDKLKDCAEGIGKLKYLYYN